MELGNKDNEENHRLTPKCETEDEPSQLKAQTEENMEYQPNTENPSENQADRTNIGKQEESSSLPSGGNPRAESSSSMRENGDELADDKEGEASTSKVDDTNEVANDSHVTSTTSTAAMSLISGSVDEVEVDTALLGLKGDILNTKNYIAVSENNVNLDDIF